MRIFYERLDILKETDYLSSIIPIHYKPSSEIRTIKIGYKFGSLCCLVYAEDSIVPYTYQLTSESSFEMSKEIYEAVKNTSKRVAEFRGL